jgi:SAM-dependent methyltransferase
MTALNEREISENHENYLERRALYGKFGYDMDAERGFVLERAKPIRGKILEAGTGKGHFAVILARDGYSFVSFDISEEEQRFARLNLAYFGLEKLVDLRIDDAEHTGFGDGSFDVIFSVNVIHHLNRPFAVMDEMVRILSPGGKLVLADFTQDGFRIMDKIHALEGKTHTRGELSLADAGTYLSGKGFWIKKSGSGCQDVIVAGRDKGPGK